MRGQGAGRVSGLALRRRSCSRVKRRDWPPRYLILGWSSLSSFSTSPDLVPSDWIVSAFLSLFSSSRALDSAAAEIPLPPFAPLGTDSETRIHDPWAAHRWTLIKKACGSRDLLYSFPSSLTLHYCTYYFYIILPRRGPSCEEAMPEQVDSHRLLSATRPRAIPDTSGSSPPASHGPVPLLIHLIRFP